MCYAQGVTSRRGLRHRVSRRALVALRPYLESQADRIEAVLAAHHAPGRIHAGTVGPRRIRFFLHPAPYIPEAQVCGLVDDLAAALRVPTLTVAPGREGLGLTFPHPNAPPVGLPQLLAAVPSLAGATAVLGIADDNQPLLVPLSAPGGQHILVTGAGSREFLHNLALSSLLTQPGHALAMVYFGTQGTDSWAGRLTRPPIQQETEVRAALHTLSRWLTAREQGARITQPPLVVVVEELATLLRVGGTVATQLVTRLLSGTRGNLHLVAATQIPRALPRPLTRFPLRVVGPLPTAAAPGVIGNRPGVYAHWLSGPGHFLALSEHHGQHFQAAQVTGDHLRTEEGADANSMERRGTDGGSTGCPVWGTATAPGARGDPLVARGAGHGGTGALGLG